MKIKKMVEVEIIVAGKNNDRCHYRCDFLLNRLISYFCNRYKKGFTNGKRRPQCLKEFGNGK